MYQPRHAHRRPRMPRRGATATELVVAATLLVSAIGTVAPLAVGASRIRHDARHHQLALEELSNQLDRLSSLDADRRDSALAELAPSAETSEVLPGATLQGEIVRDEDGARLILTLDWKRAVKAVPLQLVGWLDALPVEQADRSSDQATETATEQTGEKAERS